MSGFETLAQVYREIAYPKLKNLRITGNIVCIYSVVCTGLITLFVALFPIPVRPCMSIIWLGGLTNYLVGPANRAPHSSFQVLVGVLIGIGAGIRR